MADQHPDTTDLRRYFAHEHLPPPLAMISLRCGDLVDEMIATLPDSLQLRTGIQKLLEAKDCFVRAALPPAPAYPLIRPE